LAGRAVILLLEGTMQTRHEYMMYELKKLIREAIQFETQKLAFGNADDYAAYQRIVGKIEGFGAAIDLCDEAEKIVERTV